MYCQSNDKCNRNSTAEMRLQCKDSINFSSLYLNNLKIGELLIGYGEPPQAKELKSGKKNPFFENRMDGYLFIITSDMQAIEILTVPNGRYLIQGIAKQLADGQLNDALEQARMIARTI